MLSELIFILFFELIANDCFQNLKELTSETDTDQFIEYLEDTINQNLVSPEELISLLNNSLSKNPIKVEDTYIDISKLIVYETIESFFSKPLNYEKIITWVTSFLKINTNHILMIQDTVESAKRTYLTSSFKRITTGSFVIDDKNFLKIISPPLKYTSISIKLTHPLEIDIRPITNGSWKEIMGDYPDTLSNNEYQITHRPEDLDSYTTEEEQLDYPCEVTFCSALAFANKISILNDLPPVYSLDNTTYGFYGTLETGTLILKDQKEIVKIIPINDYYNQDGYRLPTATEQLYLKYIAETKDQKIWYKELVKALNLIEEYKLTGSVSKKDVQQFLWDTLIYLYNFTEDNKLIQYQDLSNAKPLYIDDNKFYGLFNTFLEWGIDGSSLEFTEDSLNIDPIFYNDLDYTPRHIKSGISYLFLTKLNQLNDNSTIKIESTLTRSKAYNAFRLVRSTK